MHINFVTLKNLNLENLYYYSNLLQSTNYSLLAFTYTKFALSIVFMSVILVSINVFGYFKFRKFKQMYQVYTMLNIEVVGVFLKYFV